jgi:hypothetical protein
MSSHVELKKLGGGRINPKFAGKTSKMSDPDIKQLVNKYPRNGYKGNSSLNETLSDKRNGKKLDYILGPSAVLKQVNNASFSTTENQENQMGNSVLLHKCIDAMTKNIDRIDRASQKYYKEMITKMVTQDIRDIELKKTIEVLKELDEQAPSKLPYEY